MQGMEVFQRGLPEGGGHLVRYPSLMDTVAYFETGEDAEMGATQ